MDVHVGGDVVGQLVVGDHNITVWAEQSVVSLTLPAQRPQPVRRPAISLLPRHPARPIGREQDLDALRGALQAARLVQLHGPPGVGKSTLFRYAAGDIAGLGRSVVFLSAAHRGVPDLLQDVFEACYDTAGYRPSTVEIRRLMSGVDVLVLVDDLELTAEQREELLDGVPDAAVAFTSVRRALWTDGYAQELSGLAWEPACTLLGTVLNRSLAEHELLDLAQLWRAADGSPLLLLRAAASARPGPDGALVLPRAAELAELLPRVLAGLTAPARELVSVLALADAPVSEALVPWLVSDPGPLNATLGEVTAHGVVLVSERGWGLAPGVRADLVGGIGQLEWIAGRLRECCRQLPPALIAANATLVTGCIDASVRLGRPDLGALLARALAPVAACSARLGAWEQILDRGRAAAELAGDRATLAYLTHEGGVHALVTGKRAVAAAAIATAVALWTELGNTAQAALAQQTASLLGHLGTIQVSGTASAASPAPVTGTPAAPVTTAAKAGFGLGAKLAVAGLVVAGVLLGGYFAVTSLRPASQSGALPTRSTTTPQTASTTAGQRKGVLPADCPTDPFFGSFDGREPLLEKKMPGSVVCVYLKGQWQLLVGVIPAVDTGSDIPGIQQAQIPGTDSAYLLSPGQDGTGELIVNIGGRSMKAQFVGTSEEAIAAFERVLGVG
ncbi:hypothetical protein GCM10010174_76820 [Kutzneria viridogrisea]|uniref:AAA family ATPase n=1 Tax=Kutzneria viridogrisea TaxID=47990 RepID=A0ABR6BNJ6_9PSEU|nr:hypothetical protein [Kutzneria viridogrisea]